MKNKLISSLFLNVLFLMIPVFLYAQEETEESSPIEFGADLMSRYIWRGCDLGGKSPSLQPSLSLNWKTKDTTHAIKIGAWGAYTFSATANEEADLFLTYTFKDMITLTINDYFFSGLNTGKKDKYFIYSKDSTGHLYEGTLSFNGTEKIPFTLLFAINFFGNDVRKIKDDGSEGTIVMSKYIELGYKKTIKEVDFNAFIGAALDDPDEDKGESGFYYNNSAGIINLGIKASKEIKITENYKLPVQCSFIVNPEAEKAYIVFGITF
ncbi:MAG: hypothetical protein A2275_06160 [Bacteroidetes bacterium RIFOXYA12_FULL_35_11]|nr:MAG: hypothetical protein A2X01_01725 [Bacteroidetes bacterium GWF2_35_48]OFY74201.1 MAG: hypothetical protein A2275_06160 [Bacteroidetes bacterium RIFOXYA12_FULL_35_11]OFY93785.1 MAG: hypothetical protein A2491_02590 [Bacteroidetes bacterium RIFOXYC12_FULL_35_7]HBX52390.1 hypothetical protein [Bacteroidales bacterium]